MCDVCGRHSQRGSVQTQGSTTAACHALVISQPFRQISLERLTELACFCISFAQIFLLTFDPRFEFKNLLELFSGVAQLTSINVFEKKNNVANPGLAV